MEGNSEGGGVRLSIDTREGDLLLPVGNLGGEGRERDEKTTAACSCGENFHQQLQRGKPTGTVKIRVPGDQYSPASYISKCM